jgi:hypothetical protein
MDMNNERAKNVLPYGNIRVLYVKVGLLYVKVEISSER